jgi:hypothetical protein
MNDFYVYVYFRHDDGTPCYVGKGKGERWRQFKSRNNPRLRSLIRKAGGELPCVIVRSGLTEAQAFEFEKAFIVAIGKGKAGPLVNFTDGGEGPSNPAPSTRLKMRAAKLNRPQSVEHRAAIGAAHLGRKRPASVGEKIRARKIGKKRSESDREAMRKGNRSRDPEVRAKISKATKLAMADPSLRKMLSEDKLGTAFSESHKLAHKEAVNRLGTRKKMSDAKKGKPWSAKRRAAFEARENKIPSDETRRKQSAALKDKPWSAARRAAYEVRKVRSSAPAFPQNLDRTDATSAATVWPKQLRCPHYRRVPADLSPLAAAEVPIRCLLG